MAEKGLEKGFDILAKEGNLSPDGITIWFKAAAIIGHETGITEDDVDAVVNEISKDKKGLNIAGLKKCVNTLAKENKFEPEEFLEKLGATGAKFPSGPAS